MEHHGAGNRSLSQYPHSNPLFMLKPCHADPEPTRSGMCLASLEVGIQHSPKFLDAVEKKFWSYHNLLLAPYYILQIPPLRCIALCHPMLKFVFSGGETCQQTCAFGYTYSTNATASVWTCQEVGGTAFPPQVTCVFFVGGSLGFM